MRYVTYLFLLLTLTGCAKNEVENKFTIQFGELEGQGIYRMIGYELTEPITIKKAKDYKFGFIITAKTKAPFKFYTISYLPDAPLVLTGTLKESSPQKFTSGIKSSEDTATSSVVIPFWFDTGDPLGTYKIDLYIDDIKLKSVVFNVQ